MFSNILTALSCVIAELNVAWLAIAYGWRDQSRLLNPKSVFLSVIYQ